MMRTATQTLRAWWRTVARAASSPDRWRRWSDPARLVLPTAMAGVLAACTEPATGTIRVATASLTPDTATIPAGRTLALALSLRDSSGAPIPPRGVVWSSNNTNVASVSPAGVVSALSPGQARIAASAYGRSALATITVAPREVASVDVTPTSVSLFVGGSAQLQARALDVQGTPLSDRTIAWSSGNLAVATVTAAGRVTAVAPGATTITASSEGRVGQVAVTVSVTPVAQVVVSPTIDSIAVGTQTQLTVTLRDAGGTVLTGRTVSWSSSNPSVTTVSSTGVVRALAPGTATVSATSEGRIGGATIVALARLAGQVTLTPSASTVIVGDTVQLRVQVTDSLGNLLDRPVTFASENGAVATVSVDGVVSGIAPGTTRISATSEGRTAFATVQVIPIPVATVHVTPGAPVLLTGASQQLTATVRSASGDILPGRTITWTSGAPAIAGVSGSGLVTAIGPGTAVVLAVVEGVVGQSVVTVRRPAVVSVTVTPVNPELPANGTVQLSAELRDELGAIATGRPVTWTSDDERVAFVTASGLVIALRAGTARITATSEGSSGSTIVTVR